MAVTIDWSTHIINVPKSDLTLVQSSPTEIRQLNLNEFRLELKEIEDNVYGMPNLVTHKHNTEVVLAGVTYARIIEILDPYTITFEDYQYAVNLVGANSNVGDKVNVNQVSVRTQNSAGLISSPLIEHATFGGAVHIDITTSNIGEVFPTGTQIKPSNNLSDALSINNVRGFNKFHIISNMTLAGPYSITNFIITGKSHINTELIIDGSVDIAGTTFSNFTISGTFDGGNSIHSCIVGNLNYNGGYIQYSSLFGTIVLGSNNDAYVDRCTMLDIDNIPIVDMGGSGQNLTMQNYAGYVRIENLTGDNIVNIGLSMGKVILDSSSVIGGVVIVTGTGKIVDEDGVNIESGSWNGVVIVDEAVEDGNIDVLRAIKRTQQLIFAN